MKTLLALLLAASAAAQTGMTAPPPGVTELHDRFVEAVDPIKKAKILDALSRTPAATTQDVQSLFDIFLRFDDTQARNAALSSLELITFENPDLDDLLLHYLQQPEPEARIFGIKGAARVRDAKAFPVIEKLAKKKFPYKKVDDAVLMSEKNEWWVHFAAVEAVAVWKGPDALPFLVKKSQEVPEVARLMGLYLWKQSLPYFEKWAASSKNVDQERAHAGLAAPAPLPELRDTRDRMLALLRDPASPRELRHQLAIKIGLTSKPEEIAGLIKEYDGLKNPEDRLMFRACLFATRDQQVAPILTKTAKEDENPLNRAGALVELKELLSPSEMKQLWTWTAANDPDEGNREMASRELKSMPDEPSAPKSR